MSIETIKTMDLVTRLQASAAATVGTYSNLVPMTAASQNDLVALTAGKIPAGFKNAELSDKASEQITKKAGKTWTPSRVLSYLTCTKRCLLAATLLNQDRVASKVRVV